MPRLTLDLLCRCTGHATKRRRDETQEQFLARVTHLYCSEKGLESIENLHLCRNLMSLYLYDNQIARIDGLNGHIPLLTHLYLQNNLIIKLENLNMLHRLTKLYISHNSIKVVEGLESLSQLSELHIAYQNLPKGEKIHFDPRTIKSLASTLKVLNVSGNFLNTLEDLAILSELQQFMANDNELHNMKDLAKVLSRWTKLWKLELNGNPLSFKQKYRDRVVTMCHKLELLDGREVTELERQFLFNWKAMRKARHQQMVQKTMNFNEHKVEEDQQPTSSLLASINQPHTMPPLPARLPAHLLNEKRRKILMIQQQSKMNRQNSVTASSELHLPLISTNKRVMLTGIDNPGANNLVAPAILPLYTAL